MAQPKPIRVKQTRTLPKGGFTDGIITQTRVVEIEEGAEMPPNSEVTTDEVRPWTKEKE